MLKNISCPARHTQKMTVTITNMHHVYMHRPNARHLAWRRGLVAVLGATLAASVLYYTARMLDSA